MEDEKGTGSSTGGEGVVSVFIELEDQNKSGRLIGLVQWRTKRAPDRLHGVGLVAVFIKPEDEIKSGRLIGLVQRRTKRAPDHLRSGGGGGGVGCSFH